MKLLCFALFACAFNLLLGFTGLLSFGHAAFFGSAAYITGWFVKSQNWTPELALLAGAVGRRADRPGGRRWSPSGARAFTSP